MQVNFTFAIGDRVQCKVTGFTGIVTGMTQWMTGCATYGVRPTELKDGAYPDAKWFDEPQIELVEANVVDLEVGKVDRKIGGPSDTPQRAMSPE